MVLALAIALWRAHGNSSFNNWIEFMRGERQGAIDAASMLQPQLVKLKRPDHSAATTLYTITGERLDISPDGFVEVPDGEQVTAMLQAGWNRVEAAAA